MKLILKKEYKDSIITRNKTVFNTNKVNEKDYLIYYYDGFADIFEKPEEPKVIWPKKSSNKNDE